MAELRPYEPTWRDRIAQMMMGDGRASPERRRFVEGLLGSSGLGNTGMGVVDVTPVGGLLQAQEAVQEGDLSGAALAVLPIPGAAKVKAAATLPMDEAARMARAKELGFTTEVFHGTRATEPFDKFYVRTGPQRHDLHGVHVGTLNAADERMQKYFGGSDYGIAKGVANEDQAASIMPMLARFEKPYVKKDGTPFSEADIRRKVTEYAKKNGISPDRIDAKVGFRNELLAEGYDHIPYINSVEDRGNVSYLALKPENLRSRWAAFDPARLNENNIMAGTLGGAALGTFGLLGPEGSSEY